jgi:RNA polymerase sigma factor (sigma-70 family)
MKSLPPRTGAATAAGLSPGRLLVVYYFARLQLPTIVISPPQFTTRLQAMFERARAKAPAMVWERFLENLYPVDAFLAAACLEGYRQAWEQLFAARAGRADRLLVDALRARAVRLFPRDEEKQDSAVADFWGHLIVSETPGAIPILARYDAQRPLVPWLIRVFQNWQISRLRSRENKAEALPEDDLLLDHELPLEPEARWHESFCDAARSWLGGLSDKDQVLLGLLWRYRLSQRKVAELLKVHEGTVSRRVVKLGEDLHESVGQRLLAEGWTGDDLSGYIRSEMASLLMEEPRLSAENLAHLLAAQGKRLPEEKQMIN